LKLPKKVVGEEKRGSLFLQLKNRAAVRPGGGGKCRYPSSREDGRRASFLPPEQKAARKNVPQEKRREGYVNSERGLVMNKKRGEARKVFSKRKDRREHFRRW